ncbi:MAG TPA: long-chain fatty acid--CoA ligase [Oligoflexia bacterium]|nr:long-chain fatty acid--CoA ligase [Oligoflexia bacterium]
MNYSIAEFSSIPQAFFAIASSRPSDVLCRQAIFDQPGDAAQRPRKWRSTTYREAAARITSLAAYLRSIGAGRDTKVAILSATRPEWLEADIAVLSLGCVSVSIYQTLPTDTIAYILYDSGAKIVFAENQEQVDKLLSVAQTANFIPGHEDRAETVAQIEMLKIISFEAVAAHPLVQSYQEIVEQYPAPEQTAIDYSLTKDDLACLVYTSGTTGPPKGVMQSHGNHLANVRQISSLPFIRDDSVIFLFLPLAHSFAKLAGYAGFLTPAKLCFPAVFSKTASTIDKSSLAADMRESEATIFPVVPRILEKMQETIEHQADRSGVMGWLLRCFLSCARQRFCARQTKSRAWLAEICFLLALPLRQKIQRMLFGRKFRICVCGAAKLMTETAEFFEMLELEIVEGYGLTETCVANTATQPKKKKLGSVGKPLAADIEISLAQDKEILIRGPHVAKGYYQRPTSTRSAWGSDGLFHTGDLGEIDVAGNLTIIGRKKEILVSSNGKKIAAFTVEKRLCSLPLIGYSVLVGEGKPYCVALISLEAAQVQRWAAKNNITLNANLHEDAAVKQEIAAHIAECNTHFGNFEAVQKFYLVPRAFSIEGGELTPTLKVKRDTVLRHYKDEIETMYHHSQTTLQK